MCNQIFKNLKKACFIGMLSVLTIAPWQNVSADICFVLDQDCINMGSIISSSTKGCDGYNADKNYGLTNDTVTCESCTDSNGATIKHKFKCKCKNNNAKCVDSKCSDCKYTTNDTCPTSEYKYSSDKGLGWDCDPCIDKLSKQWGKYKCKCDDTIGYWMVNNNCSKDPCYSIFKAPASSRVTLNEAERLENLEYTCDKCAASEQSQFAGKASCVCDGIIDSQRNNRCIPKGRCDTAGYYYTKASCQAVWGLSGICREITSGQYKYCIQGEDDKDDVCPSPWKTKKSDCTTPFIAEHPSVTTPKSHQPCFDCREKECKQYEGFNYFKEECTGDQEEVNVPLSASNVTSVSGGKKLSTIDLECTCPQEGPGSGKEKELNGQMYTYYDMSPCCKWLTKVDADTKQILEDIKSLKDKSPNCAENSDKCWYNTFTSRGCTKRYEDEMKSKEYKWTDADKKSKEYARTHFCYYPEKNKCDIMNKCDLYKCDKAYFKIKVHNFACITNAKFANSTTTSDKLEVGQPTQINANSSACNSYSNQTLKGWVLGETPPDISTADSMYAYMKSYSPKKWQSSSSITITAELLRNNNVQTSGDCAGNIEYGVLNVFPYVEISCPSGSYATGTDAKVCSADSHSAGWGWKDASGVYSKACKICNKVYGCSTGYGTTAEGGYSTFGTDNNYYGDEKCYRLCPPDFDYNKKVSSCGSTGSSGWELETWTSNDKCKKCKAKSCAIGYSTTYTSYGTSGYSGNSRCYRICHTDYEYNKTVSSCGSTGSSGWKLDTWSSNSSCKKCSKKSCSLGSTSGEGSWTGYYSGNSKCYYECPTGYSTSQSCATGKIKEYYSSTSSCYKCVDDIPPMPTDPCEKAGGWLWHTESKQWTCCECTGSDGSSCTRDDGASGTCCGCECVAATSCPGTCSSGGWYATQPSGYTCTSATGGSGYCCHH